MDQDRTVEALRRDLRTPTRRNGALRELAAATTTDQVRDAVLPDLVALASSHHSDLDRVREVIGLVPPPVLDQRLWPELQKHLRDADWEAYRCFAQLLDELERVDDLARLVALARPIDDVDIQEVVETFGAADGNRGAPPSGRR